MEKKAIAVVGLGYVGLPLAIEFSRKYKVVGYDINEQRIAELSAGIDRTAEVESSLLKERLSSDHVLEGRLFLTSNLEDIRLCQIYIITVPTPISKLKNTRSFFLLDATKSIAQILKKRGTLSSMNLRFIRAVQRKNVCLYLESESSLKYNQDFFYGYSPERINPGDKKHTLTTIKKVISASTPTTLDELEEFTDQ